MKLIRNAFALGFAVSAVSLAACSSQHGSTAGGPGAGGQIGINSTEHGATGSVGMHLTIGNGVHVNSLNWTISNGTNSYSGTVFITDDAGNEAQSIEFVAGGVQAGGNYIITLSGADSSGDPCSGTSMPVTVSAGATSAAVVIVTCTVPTDASLATTVDSGNIAVDAGVVLVSQAPFVCPGITGVSISPAELLPPQTAALSAGVTGSSGGTQTLLWTSSCPGANFSSTTSPDATFACGSTPPGTVCTVTLTVGLNGTGPDGGSVGQVCTGVGVSTTSETIVCEAGGSFACFPPTPNLCGTNTCVNFQTDVNNCGSCGNVCGAATPACSAGVCIAQPPTACTTAPCNATGPNSVQCNGNTAAPNVNVCTPTEALIVKQDIASGNLTGGQLDANKSCYECLLSNGGLDDNLVASDKGNECGDVPASALTLTGENPIQACLDTLGCLISSASVTASPPAVALCGTAAGSACLTAGAANGPCLQNEINGLDIGTGTVLGSLVEGDPTATNKAYTNKALASGMANAVGSFAFSNCQAQCAPSL